MISVPNKPKLTNSAYWNYADSAVFTADGLDPLEVLTFEYSVSQQKLPIYGYKSVVWDAIMSGTKLIQGNFSIPISSADETFYDFFDEEDPTLNKTSPINIKDDEYAGLKKHHVDIYIGLSKKEIEEVNNIYITNPKKFARKLSWIILTSRQQSIDPSGGQLLEIFSFLAKETEPYERVD